MVDYFGLYAQRLLELASISRASPAGSMKTAL